MQIGKLKTGDLKNLILKNIKNNRKEVISNPEIGGDCAIVACGDEKLIYLSSDPITGATNSLGKLAIHINANDIATSGVSPLGVMITILAPENTEKYELENIILEAQAECDRMNMSILGGHTEITGAVNRIIVSVTAIGIGERKDIERRGRALSGDLLLITKGIGIEGTGIIALEKENELLLEFGSEFVDEAKKFIDKTSVVREGEVLGKFAKGMHDVTEGGILGAVWEMAELFDVGVNLNIKDEMISKYTQKISEFYKIDPLKLISSGTMLVCIEKSQKQEIIELLQENRIEYYFIGEFINSRERKYIFNGEVKEIEEPESDELYRVVQ
ncbi:MAG: AIR synthase-related protein [Fusobacteriaceae bacterium]